GVQQDSIVAGFGNNQVKMVVSFLLGALIGFARVVVKRFQFFKSLGNAHAVGCCSALSRVIRTCPFHHVAEFKQVTLRIGAVSQYALQGVAKTSTDTFRYVSTTTVLGVQQPDGNQ